MKCEFKKKILFLFSLTRYPLPTCLPYKMFHILNVSCISTQVIVLCCKSIVARLCLHETHAHIHIFPYFLHSMYSCSFTFLANASKCAAYWSCRLQQVATTRCCKGMAKVKYLRKICREFKIYSVVCLLNEIRETYAIWKICIFA